jgi:hypothetical protein
MAIAKKPTGNRPASPRQDAEQAAEAFISGAGKASDQKKKDAGRTPVTMRFDTALLEKIDEAAGRRGVSRTAWLQFIASKALDQDER